MERKRVTAASHKSDAIKKQIIDFLMQGYSVQRAMDAVGRSVKTYEYYRKTDPDFAAGIDKLRALTARGEIGGPTQEVPPFDDFSLKYLGVQVFEHQRHWIDLLESRVPTDVHPSIIYEPGDKDLLIVNTCNTFVTCGLAAAPWPVCSAGTMMDPIGSTAHHSSQTGRTSTRLPASITPVGPRPRHVRVSPSSSIY